MKKFTPLVLYFVAISLIGLTSTLAYLMASRGIEQRESDAAIVNLSGRQRMLSQRIAKNCLLLGQDTCAGRACQAVEAELRQALSEWQSAQQRLVGGQQGIATPSLNTPEINEALSLLQFSFDQMVGGANALLKGDIVPDGRKRAVQRVLSNEANFLRGMDGIVLRYQEASTHKIKQLVRLETVFWAGTLLVLLLELVFIFFPLNKEIKKTIHEQAKQRDQIEAQATQQELLNMELRQKEDALRKANLRLQEQNKDLITKQIVHEKSMAQLQQMQHSLLEAEKLATLGETVGVITHEINTPIGIAVTAASSLQEYTLEFERLHKENLLKKSTLEAYLAHSVEGSFLVLSNLQKAAQLVQDFKNVAVRQLSGQREHFDLTEILRQVANTMKPFFKSTQINFELDLPDKLEIDGHPGLFAQIVMNLVSNSLKHGYPKNPKIGTLQLQLSLRDNQLVMRYQDDGVGIPKKLLPIIFEPFFTTGIAKGGSGLGLSIVQNLVVKQLGGTIVCQSEAGHGVLFDIAIPLPQHQTCADAPQNIIKK